MIRITIACPEALMGDANELASVLGLHPDDVYTFTTLTHEDVEGNAYSVVSMLASPNFPEQAVDVLHEPEWGANLAAARRAQYALAIYEPPSYFPDEEEGEIIEAPFAAPGKLAAVIGDGDVLGILGLTRIA